MKTFKLLFAISVTLLFVLVGCSNDEPETGTDSNPSSTNESGDENAVEEGGDGTDEGDSNVSLEADEETANELKDDENVEDVMIQIETRDENKFVNADITVASEVDGEEAATKYADILKEKYPDHIIDIIIVHDGTILHQQTFE